MVDREINKILNSFAGAEDERLQALSPLQYRVLKLRYKELKSWKEIGALLGYDLRQLYRIRNRAFDELRKSI